MLNLKKIGKFDVYALISFFAVAGMIFQVCMWRIQLGDGMGTVFCQAVSKGQPLPRLEGFDVYRFFFVFAIGMSAQSYRWHLKYLEQRRLTLESSDIRIGEKVFVVASIPIVIGFLVLIDVLLLLCADVHTVIGVIFGYVFATNGLMYIAIKACRPRSLGMSV